MNKAPLDRVVAYARWIDMPKKGHTEEQIIANSLKELEHAGLAIFAHERSGRLGRF